MGAIADYSAALDIDANSVDALRSRTALYLLEHDFERARQDADRLLEIRPDVAEGYSARGLLYFLLGRPDDAVGDFNRAIADGADNKET